MTDSEILELIARRRRQILVHSIIYYKLDDNLISDAQWTSWAQELAHLQNENPELAKEGPYADAYKGFEGCSGFDLPLDDPWGVRKARQLLRIRDKRKGE